MSSRGAHSFARDHAVSAQSDLPLRLSRASIGLGPWLSSRSPSASGRRPCCGTGSRERQSA
eukprot:1554647-Alexandrium_andersonii.AAC.1